MAALGLKPRGQTRQPLRGGVNEHGFQVLVETSEDENTDKNEKHAKRRLDGWRKRTADTHWREGRAMLEQRGDRTTSRSDLR